MERSKINIAREVGSIPDGEQSAPLALLFCSDLMFGVRLQNMSRKAGFRFVTVRPGTKIQNAAVLIVDISDRGNWEEATRQAHDLEMPVIAFGPHMDMDARRKAKAAGATRVLANSNLERDLPGILLALHNIHNVGGLDAAD